MSKYANRIKKIEVAKRGKFDPNWRRVDECGHALFVDQVEKNPDMRLVQRCDTDLLIYSRIQVTIAYADYDEQLLNRWCKHSMPTDPPREANEGDDEYVLRCMHAYSAACPDLDRREAQAIENARARVAAAKQGTSPPTARESAQ